MSEPGYIVMPVQAEYGHHSRQSEMNAAAAAVDQSLRSQSQLDNSGSPISGTAFGLGQSMNASLGNSSVGVPASTSTGSLSNSTLDRSGYSSMGGSGSLGSGSVGGQTAGTFDTSLSGLPGSGSSGILGGQGFDALGTSRSGTLGTRHADGIRQQQEHAGPLKKAMANTDSLYKYLDWQDPLRTIGSYFGVLTLLFGLHYFPLTQLLLKGGATLLGVMTVASFAGRSFSANPNVTARPAPRQYAQVPEATLNATLRDVHDFIQYAVVEMQRIVFGEDLNRTFAAFIGCTALYWSIKFLAPFWLAVMGITSVYIGTLAASPRGRQAARNASARAGDLANTAAEKGKVMAQSGQEQAANLTAKARGTAANAQQTVADTAKSGQQTASSLAQKAVNTTSSATSDGRGSERLASRGDDASTFDRSSNRNTTSNTNHSILNEDDTNYSISSRLGTERLNSGTSDNLSSRLGNTPGSSFDSTSSHFNTNKDTSNSVPRFGTATVGQPSTTSYSIPDSPNSRTGHIGTGAFSTLRDESSTNPFLSNTGLGSTGGTALEEPGHNTASDVDDAKRFHNTVSVGRTDV